MKKATKPSPLSSCEIQELTLAIREHNVSDNSETCDCTQELEVDLPTGAKTDDNVIITIVDSTGTTIRYSAVVPPPKIAGLPVTRIRVTIPRSACEQKAPTVTDISLVKVEPIVKHELF